ncbi:MAG TPA: DUF2851 family protein [Candidatus Cloacimonetes bacterium]|nr:DUF2851 family protein [Candidatus Cloacimonadota bacterium]HEX37611.1 DUF2851 family protein [Candidatus Cloacimonadota bacterium]
MEKYIAENFLYHIWDEQHLKRTLYTIDGKSLKILFQGKWNTDAGPDFINSILLLNNEKVQGDVEIHRTEYDWKAHIHHEDARYNNVILHVVFENEHNKEFTITENGSKIPILELRNNLDQQLEKLWKRFGSKPFDTSQKETIECQLCEIVTKEELENILKEKGLQRFYKKCKRFSAELVNSDFNQILFEGILEALGYTKNKVPFYKLAKLLSYKRLQTIIKECKNENDLFSILLYASGLTLEDYHFEWIDKSLKVSNKKILLKLSSLLHPLEKSSWNFFRSRPQNHPVNRMWQISPFLFNTMQRGNLINTIISIFSIPDTREVKAKDIEKEFITLLETPAHPSIGKSRSRDIFANIVLPVSYVYAQTLNYYDMQNFILKVYSNLSKLSDNHITNYMKSLFRDNLSFPITLDIQQGMIQLYYLFCCHHECENCITNLVKK